MANRLYNKQVTPKGYKMGGRVKKMGGGMMNKRPMYKDGSLKPVPAENKGLSKLPTKVRNKMGFMKKGGRVKLKEGSKKFREIGGGEAKKYGPHKVDFFERDFRSLVKFLPEKTQNKIKKFAKDFDKKAEDRRKKKAK